MPGIPIVTKTGPITYTPAVPAQGELPISGGLLVEGRPGSTVGVAAAASLVVLGVAVTDAQAPSLLQTAPTVGPDGRYDISAAQFPTSVAVAHGPQQVPLQYSASATFGELLVCTGNGQVGPAGATPDVRTIVGRCTEPEGVTVTGGVPVVALARLFV